MARNLDWIVRPPRYGFDRFDLANPLARDCVFLALPAHSDATPLSTVRDVYTGLLANSYETTGTLDSSQIISHAADPTYAPLRGPGPAFSREGNADSGRMLVWNIPTTDTDRYISAFPYTLFGVAQLSKGAETSTGAIVAASATTGTLYSYIGTNGSATYTALLSHKGSAFVRNNSGSTSIDRQLVSVVGLFLSSTSRELFVNGQYVSNSTASGPLNANDRFCVGGYSATSTGAWFRGRIYQAGISRRAWSRGEIQDYARNPWQMLRKDRHRVYSIRIPAAYTATAALTGDGSSVVAGTVARFGASALAGTGTATVSGFAAGTAAAALTGSGSLAVSGIATVAGAAALTGTGTETVTGTTGIAASAALTGAGTESASAVVSAFGVATLTGTSGGTVIGLLSSFGEAVLTAAGSMVAYGIAPIVEIASSALRTIRVPFENRNSNVPHEARSVTIVVP